jgi:hypothetical protein
MLIRDIAMLTKTIPFRGDFQKLMRMKIRQAKGDQTEGRATPSSVGPSDDDSGMMFDDTGSEVESDYEEISEDYD